MKAIYFRGRYWKFRECDTDWNGMDEAYVTAMADTGGRLQYESNGNVWLVVPGVGYGWEVKGEEA